MRLLLLLLPVVATLAGCGDAGRTGSDPANLWTGPILERLYAPGSPWNAEIATRPALDPQGGRYVDTLVRAAEERGFVLAVEEWTVVLAPGTGPPSDVALDAPWAPRRSLPDVPVPPESRPDPRDDGHLAVLDPAGGCEWDLWRARRTPAGWRAAWGNLTSITGEGVYRDGLSARGSGLALAAGLVHPQHLAARRIDTALVFAFPYTSSRFVWPATKSDGRDLVPDAVPMGTRLQLDPALDLDTLDLRPYERVIARALQTHGMIVGDSGGAPSLYAVHPWSFPGDPYGGLLPPGARVSLDGIPLERMRVLAAPPVPPESPVDGCRRAR